MDAACFITSNSIGIGAILRDHRGAMAATFTRKFASPFAPLVAEPLVVREGIHLLIVNGLRVDYI